MGEEETINLNMKINRSLTISKRKTKKCKSRASPSPSNTESEQVRARQASLDATIGMPCSSAVTASGTCEFVDVEPTVSHTGSALVLVDPLEASSAASFSAASNSGTAAEASVTPFIRGQPVAITSVLVPDVVTSVKVESVSGTANVDDALQTAKDGRQAKCLLAAHSDINDRIDQVLDACIEIESNKRLLDENLNYVTLSFNNQDMEHKVSARRF
jgi:hypothetical protein